MHTGSQDNSTHELNYCISVDVHLFKFSDWGNICVHKQIVTSDYSQWLEKNTCTNYWLQLAVQLFTITDEKISAQAKYCE